MLVVLPACGECATMGVFSIWCLCHEAQAVEIFVHNAFVQNNLYTIHSCVLPLWQLDSLCFPLLYSTMLQGTVCTVYWGGTERDPNACSSQ